MKILGREELWIHTHFLTDCTRLPEFRMREILKEMDPFFSRYSIIALALFSPTPFSDFKAASSAVLILTLVPAAAVACFGAAAAGVAFPAGAAVPAGCCPQAVAPPNRAET